MGSKYLTTTEIAALAGVHVQTVRYWTDKGLLPFSRLGHTRLVREADAQAFLARREADRQQRPLMLHEGILPLESARDAWIAGFFDGEGSIGTHRGTSGIPRVKLAVVNTYKPAIELIWQAFGGYRTITAQQTSAHRTCYKVVLTGEKEVITALERMLPYLVVKRDQAILALRLISRIRQFRAERGRNWTDEAALAELWELANQAQALRHETFD